MKMESSKI